MWKLSRLFGESLKETGPRITRLYAVTIGGLAVVGLLAAAALLLELAQPTPWLLNPVQFGSLLTLHGIIMVFLVTVHLFPAVLGTAFIPKAVGASKLAMPRANLFGWLLFTLGSVAVVCGAQFGRHQGGWKMTLPPDVGAEPAFVVLVAGLGATALASLIVNLSLVATVFAGKHRSISLSAVPLSAWFFVFGSLMQLVVVPARFWFLAARLPGVDEALINPIAGIEPSVLLRHLFWIYANPAILSVLLPAIGVACAIIEGDRSRVRLPRRSLLAGGIALSLLGLVSWGQHLLTAFDPGFVAVSGSLYGLLTIVPATLIFFVLLRHWLPGGPYPSVPNLALFGQISTFAVLVLSGVALAVPATGVHLHNTYTTVAHLHFGVIGIGVMGFVAGAAHFRSRTAQQLSKTPILGMILGLHATFIPLILIGLGGAPRAYQNYAPGAHSSHIIAAIGGLVLIVSVIGWLVDVWRTGRRTAVPAIVSSQDRVGDYAAEV
ncbi:MAG: cbb3-type cytochrome c oxidase subunit I [candidate division Zixibacteria bacterium]|jgi:heme/copper-type cytochrome/quinol oxidase subunit 1|nr:cbb3-type cytochrome c oxidase subunit I [candidate division Zixibacteria bacterium]